MNTPRNKAGDLAEAGGWLHLAAAPAFAAMTLATAVAGTDPGHVLCQAAAHGPSWVDGMTFMYLLMTIFHAAPWWKWLVLRTRARRQAGRDCTANPAAVESR
ncbi:MAG TPA: hypothetical protein VJ823_04210 [Rhodanobacteraceae bacterium]|nr:hypothetical protein [Rhodanobacteraceae bacterium]